jgi:hypothetical protein
MANLRNFEVTSGKIKGGMYCRIYTCNNFFYKIKYDDVGDCNKCVQLEIFSVGKWDLKLFLEILSVWYWHSFHKQIG